jgi:steroid delta-isomerase-like uncharacterized protein
MRLFLVLMAILAVLPVASHAGSADDNVKIVEAMTEAINVRNFDALDKLIATDVKRHCAATPGVNVTSLAEFKAFLEADLAACPDAQQTVNIIFSSGDMVAVHATYAGTQTGPMGPFPPSGKKLELPFIGILRIEDGKIAEIWVEWDNLIALTQLGHFPPPPPPPVGK